MATQVLDGQAGRPESVPVPKLRWVWSSDPAVVLGGTMVGKKTVMAVTGVGLAGFVIAHVLGNLKIFLGAETIDASALSLSTVGEPLFLYNMVILFLWQVPRFPATAWILRLDYCRAGLCMLPSVDREGRMIGRLIICYCLALVAASFTPLVIGGAGRVYLAGALVLAIGFLACAGRFSLRRSQVRARAVLRASMIYLPALLTLLLLDCISHR